MNVEQEVKEGNRAKNILDDPIFKDAYDQIELALINKLKTCSLTDFDSMQAWVASLQAHCEGRKQLARVMETGILATEQIAQQK